MSTSHTTTYTANTAWTASRTTSAGANTSRSTTYSYVTTWEASRSTDDGLTVCLVEGTEIHISTNQTKPIEDLLKYDPVLTMDGPFNVELEQDLLSVRTTTIADTLSSDDMLVDAYRYQAIGIFNINNGLLKSSGNHLHIVKRNGQWRTVFAYQLAVGDYLYHITDGEIEITSVTYDDTTVYTIYKLDTEPNDTFFANGILTHNKKLAGCDGIPPEQLCDPGDPCYDPCNPEAWMCEYECGIR